MEFELISGQIILFFEIQASVIKVHMIHLKNATQKRQLLYTFRTKTTNISKFNGVCHLFENNSKFQEPLAV